MDEEEIDRSALEAAAEVLPERELMSLISPDSGVGVLPVPGAENIDSAPGAAQGSDAADTVQSDAEGSESNTPDDRNEQVSQSDSASPSS